MKDFIERKMFEIYNDFIKEVDKRDSLCELKSLRFDGEKSPNYHNPLVQMLFLLRYLPAYMVEYYNIYKQVIDKDFLYNFDVLSIGAGCGTDYWGLHYAVKDSLRTIDTSYIGVDPVDWKYRENLGNSKCRFIYSDINNYRGLKDNFFNVIIFPKSIGEFSELDFGVLKNIFKNMKFLSGRLVMISTARKTRKNEDIQRIEELKDIIIKNSFLKLENVECYDSNTNNKLENYCRYFYYPEQIKKYITNLSSRCKSREKCPDKYIDREMFDRFPILTTSQICYQIYYFRDPNWDEIPF